MELEPGKIGGHILTRYDEDLEAIRTRVLTMGGLVEEQIANAMKALREEDSLLGESVVTGDYQVNDLEVTIDEECTRIIALRQPTASDLRMVMAIVKTITDLERIGDEAEKIGRMAARLAGTDFANKRMTGVQHLGGRVRQMVQNALDAFARLDVDAAGYEAADRLTSVLSETTPFEGAEVAGSIKTDRKTGGVSFNVNIPLAPAGGEV